MSRFEVLILGNSSAIPAYDRHPTSQLINIHEQLLLIDCGEGTQERLVKNRVKAHKIQQIFISHLHGDHYFGLPGLITSLNLTGRKTPLHIYSPPGLELLIAQILGLADARLNFDIHWVELKASASIDLVNDGIKHIYAFPLKHRILTYGFVIEELPGKRTFKAAADKDIPTYEIIRQLKLGMDVVSDDGVMYKCEDYTSPPGKIRKYSYCSDTAYEPGLVTFIQGSNTLYHEATYTQKYAEKAKEHFHSTASEAAKMAQISNAQKLLIGHFSSRYTTLDELLAEAKSIFPNTELAMEGRWFNVG